MLGTEIIIMDHISEVISKLQQLEITASQLPQELKLKFGFQLFLLISVDQIWCKLLQHLILGNVTSTIKLHKSQIISL